MNVPPKPEYVLGHSESELQRLSLQAQYWGEATLELLQRAGIGPGMRLLDLGCSAGDVSILAATLIGSSGHVIGVDRSAEAIAAATTRANAAGMTQIQFQVANLEEYGSAQLSDGIIGRFLLLYLADLAAVLRKLLRLVRPDGVVAFLEMDGTAATQCHLSHSLRRLWNGFARPFDGHAYRWILGGRSGVYYARRGCPIRR